MARKEIVVSDVSGKVIEDSKQSAIITIKYDDARRGIVVLDAHVDDKIVTDLVAKGRPQARRGRRPAVKG